jgi:predicted ArsR family transcriptional regulator
MAREAQSADGGNNTRHEILKFLKTEGPADAATLGGHLRLTAMAVRQHLYELEDQKFVVAEERPVPLGRPAKYWQLTAKADRLFPQAYAELSLSLIDAVDRAFGESGVQKVIAARYKNQVAAYLQQIAPNLPLKEKLRRLVRIRVAEGYMAELVPEKGDTFLLVENHCPICAAAKVCRGFCMTEQDLFRAVLGENVTVERVEHIVAGDRRCAYRIQEQEK